MTGRGPIVGCFVVEGADLRGFAYDAADHARQLVVELLVDGWPIDLARADGFAPEASDIGDGCHGFGFRLPDVVRDDGGAIEVRIANTGEVVGDAVSVAGRPVGTAVVGHGSWAGGLLFHGWLEMPRRDEVPRVRLVVDRRTVAAAEARGFTAVEQGRVRRTKARFDVRLPEAYADGRVHRVTLLDGRGRELTGSPIAVLALDDGLDLPLLAEGCADDEDASTMVLRRLMSRSMPFADLDAWSARFPTTASPSPEAASPTAVILLGEDVEASLASLDAQDHHDWFAVAVPPDRGVGTFDPSVIASVLAAEAGTEVVVVLPAGARLRPHALSRLGTVASAERAAVYADAAVDTARGPMPLLWPAFDPVRQHEQGYAALAFAAPVGMMAQALREGARSVFALFDSLAGRACPIHLPELLVDLPRPHRTLGFALRDATAEVTGMPTELRAPDPGTGLPSVAARPGRRGVASAVAVIQPELWIPDLAALTATLPDTDERVLVSRRPIAVPRDWSNVVVGGVRNLSRLRDAALKAVRSDHLLLLDAGVEPAGPAASGDLRGRLGGGVVAVGGILLDEDGMIASAGCVLGLDFSVADAFAGFDPDDGGYAGMLAVARSCGALDDAALVLDRAAALDVGGFEAALFPKRFGGIDLSLKLRAAGGRLVVSPDARFIRRRVPRGGAGERGKADELALLRRRWGTDLADDPFYHPGLNSDGEPFTALARPPRPREPRGSRTPQMLPSTLEAK